MSPLPLSREADLSESMARSASKRKRTQSGDFDQQLESSQIDRYDADVRTPKRSRHANHRSDVEASDEATPSRQRSVRRKKGIRNLSLANIRDAAQEQVQTQSPARESRFQEGSLTDKPCEKPPSIFTRIDRTDSGHLVDVDNLMEEYHADASAEIADAVAREREELPSRLATIAQPQSAKNGESTGFFRFGRQLAQNFRPTALWNKIWKENDEHPTRETTDTSERRTKQKADAEAKYAELKQAGGFGLRPLDQRTSTPAYLSQTLIKDEVNPHHEADESFRSTSAATQIIHSSQAQFFIEPVQATKSRPRFKRPSLSNIKDGLKRMGSDLNLAGAYTAHREPSSSVSPEKIAPEQAALYRSRSRYDLKKQQKLTKRVSDLEFKLQQARKELGDAISAATPMPNLGSQYERFTPSGTVTVKAKQPRFVPGKLPSLPSERVLMAQEVAALKESENHMPSATEDGSVGLGVMDELDDEETTVRALKPTSKPHVSSVFDYSNGNIENHPPSSDDFEIDNIPDNKPYQPYPPRSSSKKAMDPTTMAETADQDTISVAQKPSDYASLDAKLKALEYNTKLAERAKKPKKRKPAVDDADKPFRPHGASDDDDSDWAETKKTPKKKRKSTGSSRTKRSSGVSNFVSSSPAAKASTKKTSTKADATSGQFDSSSAESEAHEPTIEQVTALPNPEAVSAAGCVGELDSSTHRDSLESYALETLAEEEEDQVLTSTMALKNAPSQPMPKPTSAHHFRAARARSTSPSKSARHRQDDIEKVAVSQTAGADAIAKPRSASPPSSDYKHLVAGLEDDDIITAVPGSQGVPELPKGAHGSFESLSEAERQGLEVEVLTIAEAGNAVTTTADPGADEFEWPEDVF